MYSCSPWGWGDTAMPCSAAGDSREVLPAEAPGTAPGQGHVWGQGCKLEPTRPVTSAGAVCPTLMVLGRFLQRAPLARGCGEVPGVPGLGAGGCPAARPGLCVCRAGPAAAARCCLARGEAAG